MIKEFVKSLPYIKRLHAEIIDLKNELNRWRSWRPPGHFYSPIPCQTEIKIDAERIFDLPVDHQIPGVDLGEERQYALLLKLLEYYPELLPGWLREGQARYCYDNEYYAYADGMVLFFLLRHLRPRRLIEVGSGYSSAMLLDTNDAFFNGEIECGFIEPYPERLKSLISAADAGRATLYDKRVQQVPVSVFGALQANDILLIDSSHVSKTGSDVNYLLFEILPRLNSGVWIHFHDIFYPFEYPRYWVESGVSWNEAYLLRAFLQNNTEFEVQFFTSFILKQYREMLEEQYPLLVKGENPVLSMTDSPASSLWIRKK